MKLYVILAKYANQGWSLFTETEHNTSFFTDYWSPKRIIEGIRKGQATVNPANPDYVQWKIAEISLADAVEPKY